MQNFDVLHVNSLKNDGSFSSTQGTYNQEYAKYNFGTLSGNHNITITPEWLNNATMLHVYGHLNGHNLIIQKPWGICKLVRWNCRCHSLFFSTLMI